MKLKVEGIEEILITDPKGVCNPLNKRDLLPGGLPGEPNPQIPTPFFPPPTVTVPGSIPAIPGTGVVNPAHVPTIWTKGRYDPSNPFTHARWGVGGGMIQRAAQDVEPDKWEKNWQAKMNGAEPNGDGGNTN